MSDPRNTAILIFSRTAEEEARAKTFSPRQSHVANRRIAQSLIRHTAATARKTGLPVFTCFSRDQRGSHFGERLANAMQAVFAQGYARVIAIGNDSPEISAALLLRAARGLAEQNLVLGPAPDGGVYLIGMHRAVFDPKRFTSLPWQSDHLSESWTTYFSGAITWLPAVHDIDRAGDLRRYLQSTPRFGALRQKLLSLLASAAPIPVPAPAHSPRPAHFSAIPQRAPPW